MKTKPPTARSTTATIRTSPSSASSGSWRSIRSSCAPGMFSVSDGTLCRVIRVNECSAVVIMNLPVRDFKTRFDKPVRFQPPPKHVPHFVQSESESLTASADDNTRAIRRNSPDSHLQHRFISTMQP